MNQTSAEIDYLIDRFVDVVNTGSREPVDPDDTAKCACGRAQ